MAWPIDDASAASSLIHRTSFVNHSELPILACAASSKTGQLLVWDGRFLVIFSGAEKIRHVSVPPAVRLPPWADRFTVVC